MIGDTDLMVQRAVASLYPQERVIASSLLNSSIDELLAELLKLPFHLDVGVFLRYTLLGHRLLLFPSKIIFYYDVGVLALECLLVV